jgi:superkiller protein 3
MKTSVMKKIAAALTIVGLYSSPALADKRLDDAIARAEDQFAKGKPEEALKTMQKVASQQSTSAEAQLALARFQQRLGSLDDAAASIAKASQLAAGPVKAEVLAAHSALDLLRGTGKDALAHAEHAVQAQPTAGALAALARAQARVQGGSAALPTADKALAADANSADAHEARGEALLALGRNEEAAAAFRKAMELDPRMNVARVRLASALLAQGQAAQAVTEARKATEADQKSAQAFAVLGLAILAENKANWSDAIAQAQNGRFLNEKDPWVQVAVGKVFEGGDNLDQAALAYKKALETDPGYTPARAALLSAQVRKGETDAALVEAQKLAAEMPESGEIQLELGRLLLRKGDFTAATPALEKAVASSAAGMAEAHALLGYAYTNSRRSAEALTAYRKATELDPKNVDYRTTYGLLLGLNKQHDAGIAELKKVIATPGYKDADAYINLGWLYRNVEPKRADEAVAAYKKALELDPKNEQAALGVGWSYFYGRKWDEALASFNKAIELEPSLAADANNAMAWAYFFKGDLPKAEEFQAKAKGAGRNDTKLATNIENKKKGIAAAAEGPDPSDEPPAPKVARADAGTLSAILLGGGDAGARRKAARDLAGHGAAGVPALIRALGDRSVREAAVASLGALGAAAKQAIPYLQQIVNAPPGGSVIMERAELEQQLRDEEFRKMARSALQRIQG